MGFREGRVPRVVDLLPSLKLMAYCKQSVLGSSEILFNTFNTDITSHS